MNAEKANIQTGVDAAEIPEYVFESLARSLLPVIQKYYESEDGKKGICRMESKEREYGLCIYIKKPGGLQ